MTVPKPIGIAIVESAGKYLVGTRGPDGPLAGYAEFPGGKCLAGESPDACAVRECLEEALLHISIDRALLRREFAYAHATVDLHFFLCHPTDAGAVTEDHNGFRWVPASELGRLKFPEANQPVIDALCNDHALRS